MTGRSVWLEVALNGPWTRRSQPRIPMTVDEIVAEGIACARAGAAILHVHAYDAATGRQKDDPDLYAAIIERIRAAVDAVVYPTIPVLSTTDDSSVGIATHRYAAVEVLARRGLLEWAVVDPGSVNLSVVEDIAREREGFVYLNPESHVRHGLALAEQHRFHPAFACYEPGFVRLGAALHRRYARAPVPIYRLMFSDQFTFGYPPEPWALRGLLALLEREAPRAPWMIGGLRVDILPLIPAAVAAGGHVRVGLEDAPIGSASGNLDWVERAITAIDRAGATLATPAEVRRSLADATSRS